MVNLRSEPFQKTKLIHHSPDKKFFKIWSACSGLVAGTMWPFVFGIVEIKSVHHVRVVRACTCVREHACACV